jgi:hypothetical protein
MYKLTLAGVYPDMGDTPPTIGGKKDQIPFLECIPLNTGPDIELGSGISRQLQPIETVDRHRKTAAIKTAAGRLTSPSV